MGQRCDCRIATPFLTWCTIFLLEVGSTGFLSLLLDISSKVPIHSLCVLGVSNLRGLWCIPGGSPKPPYFLRLPVSILSAGPQVFSPFLSPNIRSGSNAPFSPVYFPSQVPPSLPPSLPPSPFVIAFFSLPSGTEASSLGHFSLLTFLSSVNCISVSVKKKNVIIFNS
jgi:hypothetical protein